jgi:hypothetical protein
MPEINAEGVFVFQSSWLPGWQWSAGSPRGLSTGAAATKEEAEQQGRAALRTLGIAPKGQG